MFRLPGIAFLAAIMALLMPACNASASTQIFGPETYSAWIDARLVGADGEPSWTHGDFGKQRYGHGDSGLKLAQAGLVWKPRLTDTITANIVAEYVPDAVNPLGIEEAFVKWKPVPKSDWRWSLRAGQFFPPVSMEHDGTGWTTTRTLTPSAINSWVGEEILVQGAEVSVQKTLGAHGVGLTLGGFIKDDTAGTVLAWRGWAMHDIASADNTELPLPSGEEQGWYQIFGAWQAADTRPMVEVDHRKGWYWRLDWRPPVPMAFNAEFYDNCGDPQAVRNAQWGWATRFYNIGVQAQVAPSTQIMGQVLWGHTQMGWEMPDGTWGIDADYDSAYLMLSHDFENGTFAGAKLSGRLDYFNVKDNSMRFVDDNTDRGYAITIALTRPLTPHIDLTVEGVHIDSTHPARAVTRMIDPRQSQTNLQVALKVHF